MGEKKYSIRFTDEEDERYKDLMKRARSPTLANLIRSALDAACENPSILTPSRDKTDLDVLINALEISANERIKTNTEFQANVLERLYYLENSQELIMKKLKVPKKEQEKIKGETDFESVIFKKS